MTHRDLANFDKGSAMSRQKSSTAGGEFQSASSGQLRGPEGFEAR